MYEVQVESTFNALHRLPLPDGSWEPAHGHDWRVEVTLQGPNLDASGMLIDFHKIQASLNAFTSQLHHTDLNKNPLITRQPPSAEHIARVIYDHMTKQVIDGVQLNSVRVTEAPGCTATYLSGGPSL